MRTLAVVAGVGAITPVGLDATVTAFAHRAAVAAMREAPLLDPEGEPITMCFLPTLDPLSTGVDRLVSLAIHALGEAVRSLGPGAVALRRRVVVTIDEHLAGRAADGQVPAHRFAADLSARAREILPDTTIEVSPRGAAGPGFVLQQLCDELASGAIDAAFLGGVHSDYDPARVAALAESGRLFNTGNLDALIPGEAAAFAVLTRPDTARRLRVRPHAQLHALATAFERARPDNDESAFQATGLTAALRTALAPLAEDGLRAGWVLTDLTFETYRHFELSAASGRLQRMFCDPQQVDSPAQRMGHLGAAAIPLHIALASEAFRRGFAPHDLGVSIAGSDTGERAVLLLSRAP